MKKLLFILFLVLLAFFIKTQYFKQIDIPIINQCINYNFEWRKAFNSYFHRNNMPNKLVNLKQGLDDISVKYIDKFMENSKYWNKCINMCEDYNPDNLWTAYDKELFEKFKKKDVPSLYKFNPYIYKSLYGMLDLPEDVLEKINGKDIVDIGSWPGDTIFTFHKFFPKSNIYAYEPVAKQMDEVKSFVELMKEEEPDLNVIHLIQKGLSDKDETKEICFKDCDEKAVITKLDTEYPSVGNNNLGLIKMDTEGYERYIVKGASSVIKKYKPVLVIAIYHTPEDFFEMKDKIKALNPDYRFMIRRSENILPDADLVLIAY